MKILRDDHRDGFGVDEIRLARCAKLIFMALLREAVCLADALEISFGVV